MSEKKLERWQKFPLDRECVSNLRALLGLTDEQEFPESVWKILAVHKALERQFGDRLWTFERLVNIIIAAADHKSFNHGGTEIQRFVPGSPVFCEDVQRHGIYWFLGPFHKHMINCDGDLYLVKAEDLRAPESSIANSELLKNAALGAAIAPSQKIDTTIKPVNELTPDEQKLARELNAKIRPEPAHAA